MNILNITGDNKYNLCEDSVLDLDYALMMESKEISSLDSILDCYPYKSSFISCAISRVHQFANQIPVFFATRAMCNQTYSIDLLGQSMQVLVPFDKLSDDIPLNEDANTILNYERLSEKRPKGIIETDSLNNQQENNSSPIPNDADVESQLFFDHWGAYIGPSAPVKSFKDCSPMIFIWVDKIYEYNRHHNTEDKDPHRTYEACVCQVILHEVMHAIFDINIFGTDDIQEKDKHIPQWFRYLREESLSFAATFTIMNNVWSCGDMAFLELSLVKKTTPFQYLLGMSYYHAGIQVINDAIDNWINREYNPKLAEDWLLCIKQCILQIDLCELSLEEMSDLDRNYMKIKELEEYEESFIEPNLYKYKSPFSDSVDWERCQASELAKRVIFDYIKMNHPSKVELMAAFPQNLNNNFDVFIDPLNVNHFDNKDSVLNDVLGPLSAYDDFLVDCTDGKLYLCSFWHIESMLHFVDHARKLGFKIIDFWP